MPLGMCWGYIDGTLRLRNKTKVKGLSMSLHLSARSFTVSRSCPAGVSATNVQDWNWTLSSLIYLISLIRWSKDARHVQHAAANGSGVVHDWLAVSTLPLDNCVPSFIVQYCLWFKSRSPMMIIQLSDHLVVWRHLLCPCYNTKFSQAQTAQEIWEEPFHYSLIPWASIICNHLANIWFSHQSSTDVQPIVKNPPVPPSTFINHHQHITSMAKRQNQWVQHNEVEQISGDRNQNARLHQNQ